MKAVHDYILPYEHLLSVDITYKNILHHGVMNKCALLIE